MDNKNPAGDLSSPFVAPSAAMLQAIQVIPFNRFMGFSIRAWLPDQDGDGKRGKLRSFKYDPTLDYAFAERLPSQAAELVLFMLLNVVSHHRTVNWATVPEHIRRSFRLVEDADTGPRIIKP